MLQPKEASLFYWKSLQRDIHNFIRDCDVCQRCKYDSAALPGKLQPLPILEGLWVDISMDFIEGLPKSQGKEVIMVVVDRLSNIWSFYWVGTSLHNNNSSTKLLDNVYKLHGLPSTMVSDHDSIFVSSFWQEFFKLQGVELQLSPAYYPQTDSQTEVVNRCVETYLRCMENDCPSEWFKWLTLAE